MSAKIFKIGITSNTKHRICTAKTKAAVKQQAWYSVLKHYKFKVRTVNINDLGLCLSNVNKKVLSVLGYNVKFIILTLFQDLQDVTHQERAVMNLSFSSLWKKTEKKINDFNIYSICFLISFSFFSFSLDPSEFTQIKIFRASSMLQ